MGDGKTGTKNMQNKTGGEVGMSCEELSKKQKRHLIYGWTCPYCGTRYMDILEAHSNGEERGGWLEMRNVRKTMPETG